MPDTIEERLRKLRAQQSGRSIEERLAALRAQQPQPPGNVENVGIGVGRGALKYIVDPLLAVAEGWVSPQSSAQSGELAARGAQQLASQYVDPTGQLAAEQAPAIQAGQRKLAASRAGAPGFKQSKAAQDYLNARAALDPSIAGKITRGGAEVVTGALPAIATGTYGGAPMAAGVAALQSAAQPEAAAFNVGASVALPAVGSQIVGPAFRTGINAVRRAFGKGAAQIVEAEALPAATAQVRQSIPGETAPGPQVSPGNASPTVQRAMQQFEEAVQRINASNLSPAQKAAELDAAIRTIGREASGARPAPTSVYPPPMVMPENPNAIQQAGVMPRVFGDEARMAGPAGQAEMQLPKLEADLGAPSVKAAPDLPYTETVGPRINEPTDALNAAVSTAAQSVPRSVGQRVKDELLAVYHLPRSLLSSLDLSAPFRQGALLTVPPTQWGRAARAGVRMFQAFSTKKYGQIADAIANHADAPAASDAGLYLATKAEQGLAGAEEAFLSKYAGRIPLVKQSEQAYKTYLDSLRMDTFAKYKRVIDGSGLTPEQAQNAYKAAATWINYSTGRGSLGQTIDKAMPALSTVIFSPRFVASRLNVLNPVYYAKNAATAEGRVVLKQQMGELVQYAGMVTGTLALAKAAGADVNLNPNSPDFLKIRAGRWRYDLGAGLQQVMRLIYRAGEDIKNRAIGEKTQGPNALEISGNFLRSKLAPVPGAFVDFIKGRTVTGKPFSPGEAAAKLVAPIQWADFVEAYQKEGFGGVLKSSPGFVGFGVQDYDSTPINAALEKTRPLFTELERLNKRVSELRRKDGEKDDAFNARIQQFSQNYTQYGQKLLESPRFKAAPDAVKALALDALNNRAKAVTSRELALPELVLDANTIMDAAENSKKNPAKR